MLLLRVQTGRYLFLSRIVRSNADYRIKGAPGLRREGSERKYSDGVNDWRKYSPCNQYQLRDGKGASEKGENEGTIHGSH